MHILPIVCSVGTKEYKSKVLQNEVLRKGIELIKLFFFNVWKEDGFSGALSMCPLIYRGH